MQTIFYFQKMISLFTIPKAFKKEFDLIQKNAIKSWKLLSYDIEIILFGDEEGISQVANEIGLKHIPEVKKNKFGTPLVSDIFEKAQKISKNDILCYINCDIILTSDFLKIFEVIRNEEKFLIVGRRWDLDLKEEINFENINWEIELKEKVRKQGKLHPETGIDYFVFRKGLFEKIPDFAVGRTTYDEWFLWYAWKNKVKLIDATEVITVIHQNHSYINSEGKLFDPWKTEEAKINLKLAGGYKHCLTIKDATHILTEEGLKETPKMSLLRRMDLLPFIGLFSRQRFKLKRYFMKNEPLQN